MKRLVFLSHPERIGGVSQSCTGEIPRLRRKERTPFGMYFASLGMALKYDGRSPPPLRGRSKWGVVLVLVFLASIQTPAPKQTHPIALIGGTVHTVSGETIVGGTVIFADGRITAVGKDIDIPYGTERIDVTGKQVYPGLISAQSELGLTEIGAVRATNDTNETGAINPNIHAEVAVNPDSELIPVTRANGITVALTKPGGGVISGTSALMLLDGWTWGDMTYKAPVGLDMNWPRMDKAPRPWWQTQEETTTPADRLQQINQAFADARAYMKAKEAEIQKGIPYHATDLRWEAMVPVLQKKIPVFVHVDTIRQIESAVQWAKEEDVKLVIVGGGDAWYVTDLLKANDVPVIIGGVLTTPRREDEPYDSGYTLALKLSQAGVKYCISDGGDSSNARNVPYHAAMAAAFGLPKDEALKAITLYCAQILGVGDRLGSIEPGKDAMLIVTDGDPLEIPTHILMEFIEGRKVDLTTKHTMLYEKYRKKYQQMGLIK
ncbi:MAG: amidohydrolase family protein [bacterium]